MSTTVDNRVVEMRFDNRHFENNVQTSMTTLDKLKQSLNLTGATKGFESVDKAAKGVDMSTLGNAVDTVRMRFSALEVMAVTTLANITNSAVNTGKRMLSALTIDPIKTGFSEYETQINAVQTILANTSHAGTDMEQVNKALDTLNTYADKTIYNFTEMTRNIGTFTAAGVDLDTSVKSIQGIANLAAVSGSTSQQASTAMYQLSQALAAGKVSLMDWNSVVNAGMGGKVFQDALIRTSEAMGTGADKAIEKYGSFRESLTQGEWLTTEVLTKTLEQFTMAAEEGSKEWEDFKKGLMDEGYTEKQAEEILEMANTATDAATKVKTFSQLWDTLKESAQSGWTQTWEILIGDFEEAKEMLTNVSNVIGDFINNMSQARNDLLQGWKDAGGRTDLLDSLTNTFKFLGTVIKPITQAFREVFPALKVEQLTAVTKAIKNFTEKLKLSESASENIKNTFKGVFSVFDIVGKAVGVVAKAVWDLLNSDGVAKLASFLLDITGAIGNFFTKFDDSIDTKSVTGVLSGIVDGISDIFGTTVGHIETFGDLISAAGDVIVNVATKIGSGIKTALTWVTETFSAGDVFAGLAGGGIFLAAKNIAKAFKDFDFVDIIKGVFGLGDSDSGDSPKFLDQIKDVLGSVGDSLNAFTTSVKISSLVSIAVAVGILSAALKTISDINVGDTVKSLTAIGIMMGMLSATLSSVSGTISSFGSSGLLKAGTSLILIATAINILADAMEQIGGLPLSEIAKGLVGIGGGLTALSATLKVIGKVKIPLSTSVAMLALAESCSILGDALQKFATLSWDEIARGLTGMGGALVEFVAALSLMNKFGGGKSLFSSTALLIAVQSLDKMASGLERFGNMTWDNIKTGLTAMGGALAELVITLGVLGKVAGFSGIFAAGSILIVTQGLGDIADALQKFGDMTWDKIGAGLAAMGGALLEVAGISGGLGILAGLSGIIGAGTILITVQGLAELADAFGVFGDMSWDEVAIGLVGMGGALAEVAVVSGALGALTGLSGILGSGAILIAVQSLGDLASAFTVFGDMTWEEVGIGLVAMGAALTEVSVISGALGALAGLPALLGGGAILLAVQGLGDLADALQKFGDMSWSEVQIGLTAMAGALGETALGGLLNTFSGIGASAISEMAAPLGVLADSVNKWSGVTVPEGLGTQLGTLADGVKKFTFGGMGAGALAEAAAPVGTMADSISKWSGVTIPEGLGEKMGILADGIKKFTFGGMGAGALTEAAPAIGQLADGVKKWASVSVPDGLGEKMSKLADGVEKFSFSGVGASALSSAAPAIGKLADSVTKWTGLTVPSDLGSKLKTVANAIKEFGGSSGISSASKALDSFVDSLRDAVSGINSAQGEFKTAGSKIVSSFADSISANTSGISGSFTSALDGAVSAIEGYYADFTSAGSYLVDGFAAGISANTFKAAATASAMASAALAAAKAALIIKSPSRAFYSVGDFAGQGFVNALDDYAPIAARSGRDMADAARVGLSTAVDKITRLIGDNMDMTPTIRPVLDLSDVEAGTNSISSMLGLGSSIGVASRVGSISSMMNQNGQNGNAEVVSAINKLRRDLGSVGNTTYNVNGVTYDDGTNVSNAVHELVRAAKIERRS